MKRSKNHLLYELYLDEAGFSDAFEATSHISLGHIVAWVDGDDLPPTVGDYTDKDFARAAAYRELDKLDEDAQAEIVAVIYKINEYHENKTE